MIPRYNLLSPTDTFHYFIMAVWTWILLEKEISWSWSLRKISNQCRSNLISVPPRKPPDPMNGIYGGQTYYSRTRVDTWTRMDVVPVEYGTFAQNFHLMIWFFRFITGINFKWDYVMWQIIDMLACIDIWTKMRIYIVPLDPFRWSCQGFGSLWRSLMMSWMLLSKNYLKVYHRKKLHALSYGRLATPLMNFECQTFGIFEGLLKYK